MKYVARPKEFRRPDMHTVGHITGDELVRGHAMPLPDLVEIEPEPGKEYCMMYRYTKSGDFCGDTWHEDLEAAFAQAHREYGLAIFDFLVVHEGQAESPSGAA
jgi:hypothetical protein